MSVFMYDVINLSPVLTKRYTREAILHGPTYLYTRHTIRVQGIFNRDAVSYKGKPEAPTRTNGRTPNVTDTSIRHILMQPRRQLIFSSGYPDCAGEPQPLLDSSKPYVIESPPREPGSKLKTIPSDELFSIVGAAPRVDANNGPIPISCDVVRIGPNTWWVDYAVKTDINECFTYYKTPPFVLSNRWNMTHDIDVNNFTTRYVRGRAIFQTDAMLQQKVTPDMYRGAFFFPLPDNFQRESVRVWVGEDNNELNYSFVDRQKSHTIMTKNITRIEAWATIDKQKEAGTKILLEAGKKGVASGIQTGKSLVSHGVPPKIAGIVGAGAGLFEGARSAYTAVQPSYSIEVSVRVWGNSNVTRRNLLAVADRVLRIKIPEAFSPTEQLAYSSQTTANFDLMGRYVDLSTTLHSGKISAGVGASGLGFFAGNDANAPGQLKIWPQLLEDDIGAGANTIATIRPAVGKNMPHSAGTRGTYRELCVAQALQNVCQLPAKPANPPAYLTPAPEETYNTLPAPK